MNRSASYFMRDQVDNRVREIMLRDTRPRPGMPALWPLAALVAALTLANIMVVAPGP